MDNNSIPKDPNRSIVVENLRLPNVEFSNNILDLSLLRWSDSINEQIIEAVRSRPELWDCQNINFKNRNLKMKLWEEIKLELNLNDDCKTIRQKWDCIKQSYIRSKKPGASGSATGPKKDYKYSRLLSFLDDTNAPRSSIALVKFEEEGHCLLTSESSSTEEAQGNPKKRKKEEKLILMDRYVSAIEGIKDIGEQAEIENLNFKKNCLETLNACLDVPQEKCPNQLFADMLAINLNKFSFRTQQKLKRQMLELIEVACVEENIQ